jgi:hypothetical protein
LEDPTLYKPHPSLFPATLLGGLVGTVILTALIRLLAALEVTVVDLPQLIGAVFSSDAGPVSPVGHTVFLVMGVFVLPLGLALLWPVTPGDRFTFGGAVVKGALWGLVLFVVAGLLLPLLGVLGQQPGGPTGQPGPFGGALGWPGPVQLLVGTQVYALATALVAQMPRGLQPLDTLGWGWWSHGSGESP